MKYALPTKYEKHFEKKMAKLTYAKLTQRRESTRLTHTHKLTSLEKKSFLVRKVPLPGSEMSCYPGRGIRQFTDKTVHRHGFWRKFTDRIEDSSPALLWRQFTDTFV